MQAGQIKLNLNCIGEGSIARFTRVCSYDRAGYGWSESGPEPRTAFGGRQIIVPDSSHVIQFERPDVVISAIHEVWSAAATTQ